MFTNPPSISLEVIYEQEDSFIQRLQQEQDQRRHRNSVNPSSPSQHNYRISGSSPTAVVFNSSPSRVVSQHHQFQIKTVLSFPIELFLDGNSKNIEQFKQIAAENFPFEEEKKMRQKSQSSVAKEVSSNEKIIKKLYVCFPNENSVKIIQPLKEYLNSGLYRSAQGLDKLAFYEDREGKHHHQKQDKTSGEQAVYNRFYFVAHQLFVVYEDDLTQRPFPYSSSGMMNQAMDISDYINEQRSRQEEIGKIRRDFRLLSLARPTGSAGGEGVRGGNANNNEYLPSLPVTNQQRPELSSSSLAPPQNYFQNQQSRPLQPPMAPNNQNRFAPECSWEYLQNRYFANCPTHYDLEMEEAMRKRMAMMMMMSSGAMTHHNCCSCSCHHSCCCGNNNNNMNIPQQKKVNASTATGGRNGTNNNNNSLLNQSAVSVRSAGSNISRVSGNGDRVIRFNLVNQSQQEEEIEQRGYY